MPTPFMHLEIAERILEDARLSPGLRKLVGDHFPAFYFGNVAPDFHTICEIPREETHFYPLPPEPGDRAFPTMFALYPELSPASKIPVSQAAFLAGYSAHLMLDVRWFHEVMMPYFIQSNEWDNHHQRFLVHNTLLTYLDKLAVDSLPDSSEKTLAEADPQHWLPFASDEELVKWRDFLVVQLRPGTPLQTITIFAERLHMTPEEFAANLDDPIWMQENLFNRVPVDDVQAMITSGVAESIDLINDYLEVII
jgi:hypothetical protein